MDKLIDKLLILICCLTFSILELTDSSTIIFPILITIAISALNSYFENNIFNVITYIVFCIGCFYDPMLVYFLPLITYDIAAGKYTLLSFLSFIFIVYYQVYFISLPIILITIWLKYRSIVIDKLRYRYKTFRDSSAELTMSMEESNKSLILQQDYEVEVATLNERNRIAREIHDNVGHVLSSSILQVGALMAINKDDTMDVLLKQIKETLTEGMGSIRDSIHNLHDDSIDLRNQIETLIKDFSKCKVYFEYDASNNLPIKYKYNIISIIKEALSNTIKHSNGTKVSIILREHPAFLQLIVWDNGVVKAFNTDNGIGLTNIKDRVSALSGNLNITTENGFRIFVSLPKGELQ